MKTMKDCLNLYLKYNVLLLADMFRKFRNNSLKNHGLHPSHCLSAPDLGWDAMLKKTKIEFELIPDPDINIYSLRKAQKVGFFIFLIDTAKPTTKKKEESKHIYLDTNNLYSYAKFKFLPTGEFKWILQSLT